MLRASTGCQCGVPRTACQYGVSVRRASTTCQYGVPVWRASAACQYGVPVRRAIVYGVPVRRASTACQCGVPVRCASIASRSSIATWYIMEGAGRCLLVHKHTSTSTGHINHTPTISGIYRSIALPLYLLVQLRFVPTQLNFTPTALPISAAASGIYGT